MNLVWIWHGDLQADRQSSFWFLDEGKFSPLSFVKMKILDQNQFSELFGQNQSKRGPSGQGSYSTLRWLGEEKGCQTYQEGRHEGLFKAGLKTFLPLAQQEGRKLIWKQGWGFQVKGAHLYLSQRCLHLNGHQVDEWESCCLHLGQVDFQNLRYLCFQHILSFILMNPFLQWLLLQQTQYQISP